MNRELLNLFALVEDVHDPIRRIPLSGDIQIEITRYFWAQMDTFYTNQQKVEFSGNYNAEEGEIFSIKQYPLDNRLFDAIDNPIKYPILDPGEEKHRILAIFIGDQNNKKYMIGFQGFDVHKMILRSFTIILSEGYYTKLKDPGIILDDKLTTLYENGELLFYSYQKTRRFCDLAEYYCEATDTDLKDFISNRSLFVENSDLFLKNADMVVRRKVALLQKNKVLGRVSVNEIRTSAKKFGLDIKIKDGKKIVLPENRSELKNILRFLDEDYFNTVLTKRKCVTNSKTFL